MTPGNEPQRAWREAVQAFRHAATVFEDPTPELFAELASSEEGFRDLTQELPLVDFSPFGMLQDNVFYGRGAELHRHAAASGRTTSRATDRGAAGSDARSPRTSRPPGGSRDLPVMPPHAGEPARQPPIFSFRRGGASGVPAGRQHSRPDPAARERPASAAGPFRAPVSGSADSRQEGPEAVETSPDPNAPSQSEAAMDDLGVEPERGVKRLGAQEDGSVRPMNLLDGLAEDALKSAEQLTSDVPVRRSSMTSSRSAPADERTVRSPEPGRITQHDRGTDGRASGESGLPWFVAASPSPADSLPALVDRRDPDRPATIPGGSRDLSLHFPDYGSVSLIDSLTEHLLAPEAQFAGSSSASSEARDGRIEGSVAIHAREQAGEEADLYPSPAVSLDDMEEKPAGESLSGSDRRDPAWPPETTYERHVDAEAFASLVNDVLVRQARRHGVDLS